MQGKRLSSLPVSQTVCDFTSYARDEGLCVRGGGVGGGEEVVLLVWMCGSSMSANMYIQRGR